MYVHTELQVYILAQVNVPFMPNSHKIFFVSEENCKKLFKSESQPIVASSFQSFYWPPTKVSLAKGSKVCSGEKFCLMEGRLVRKSIMREEIKSKYGTFKIEKFL